MEWGVDAEGAVVWCEDRALVQQLVHRELLQDDALHDHQQHHPLEAQELRLQAEPLRDQGRKVFLGTP